MTSTVCNVVRRANAKWAAYDVPTYQRRALNRYQYIGMGYTRPNHTRPIVLEDAEGVDARNGFLWGFYGVLLVVALTLLGGTWLST